MPSWSQFFKAWAMIGLSVVIIIVMVGALGELGNKLTGGNKKEEEEK